MSQAFSVVAIVAAFNEADIVEQTVADLIDQGVEVYFIDDHSTDATVDRVQRFVDKGVRAIERFKESRTEDAAFRWTEILKRKEELAAELQADWFIHHDADEFRESPWEGLKLKDAILRVDKAGFNAIDFVSLDFWPATSTPEPAGDVRAALPGYAPSAQHDRVQIRCWKRTTEIVDLVSSGGHDVTFNDRRVFPVRFVLRHYPVRSEEHGRRKVFVERRPRYLQSERSRGWHVQHDHLDETRAIVGTRGSLRQYDPAAVRLELMLHHRGVEALEEQLQQLQTTCDRAQTYATSVSEQAAVERCRRENAEREQERLRAQAQAFETQTAAQANEIDRLLRTVNDLSARVGALTEEIAVERSRLLGELQCVIERAKIAEAAYEHLQNLARGLEAQNAEQGGDIEKLQTTVDDLTRRSDALAREAAAERGRLLNALHEATQQGESSQRALNEVGSRLSDIEHSRTWRWTAICRRVAHNLGIR